MKTTDMKNNTFRIDFTPDTVGLYKASVFFAEQEIPMSPYKINILPSVDVSKVKIQGLDDSKSSSSSYLYRLPLVATPRGTSRGSTIDIYLCCTPPGSSPSILAHLRSMISSSFLPLFLPLIVFCRIVLLSLFGRRNSSIFSFWLDFTKYGSKGVCSFYDYWLCDRCMGF